MGLLGCLHFAPPGLGWFWAGQGYKHGAPTELNERRERELNGNAPEVSRQALPSHWMPVTTPYVAGEVLRNLPRLAAAAIADWSGLRKGLLVLDDVLTVDRAAVFPVAKDRPILFSALAWADVLLTHDRADFEGLSWGEFYGLAILSPGQFLERERAAGRLTAPEALGSTAEVRLTPVAAIHHMVNGTRGIRYSVYAPRREAERSKLMCQSQGLTPTLINLICRKRPWPHGSIGRHSAPPSRRCTERHSGSLRDAPTWPRRA